MTGEGLKRFATGGRSRTQRLDDQAPVFLAAERPVDVVLLAALLGLLALGTIEVYSSSAVYALKRSGDGAYFLKRQLGWLSIGLLALWAGVATDHRWLRRRAHWLLLAGVGALVAVLFAGATINGARRWFVVGPMSLQPVEFAKLALVSYLARSLTRKADRVKIFTVGFVPHLVVCAVMMALLLKQPDLGSCLILGATTLTMLFVAGTRSSYILLAVLASAPVVYHFVVGTPWRMQRFLAYFNPEAFSDGVAYQIIQARIAVGSGGATGMGLGEGRQQLGYMPEGHSDFIMASLGEELGFVGLLLVLALFAIVVWRGGRAALAAREPFGAYLAFGITLGFALQALVNFGVVLGVLPAKGITLPFVSYGGSSLIMSMYLAGIVLNVGRAGPPSAVRRRELVNLIGARRRKRRAVVACTRASAGVG
ncbi:MAG TPA: putative lipid II flippase FtsW [Kofleriaceae bacterium]|nr:putative lipid II flippase FtsW [Kofleriaceae bacterium]